MKAILAAIFTAMLLGSASAAQYTAYFLPVPAPFSNLNGSFRGHFGNYEVLTGVKAPFPYIAVSGSGVDTSTLASEIGYLKNASLLRTDCNPVEIDGANGTDFICTPEGWNVCPAGSVCSFSPPEPATSPLAAILPSGAAKQAGVVPAPSQDIIAGAAGARAAQNSGEESAAAPPAASQPGISLEQVLQLSGALIAVVVASYLILQQRQEPIDPREEKLLDNETRAGIMQELSGADRIPTDLSIKLGKSKATVVEHLSTLMSAGFVERVSTPGKKYVFYRLTQKGKRAVLKRAG